MTTLWLRVQIACLWCCVAFWRGLFAAIYGRRALADATAQINRRRAWLARENE